MPRNNNNYHQERFPNGQEKNKEGTLGIQAQGYFKRWVSM